MADDGVLTGDYDSDGEEDEGDGLAAQAEAQQPENPVAPMPHQSRREGIDMEAPAPQAVRNGAHKTGAGVEEEAVDYD